MTESDAPDSREQKQPDIGQVAIRTAALGKPLLTPSFHIQTLRSILFGAGKQDSNEE
jgi:hypothetical protein